MDIVPKVLANCPTKPLKIKPGVSDKLPMTTKTDKILEIILTIIHEPRQMISEERLKSMIVSDKSDKTFYRWKKKLTEEELFQGYPPLKIINQGEATFYSLNNELFKYFVPEHIETTYFLEAYKKLGYLFKNYKYDEDIEHLKKDILQMNGKGEEMKRKFYFLSKTRSNEQGLVQDNIQAKLIASLIHNQVIALQYNEKFYPRVLPLCLCQYRDSFYLIGYKHEVGADNIRHFKLNRVQGMLETKDTFKYPESKIWNPETHFENSSGIITGTKAEAFIKVTGLSRGQIIERNFFNAELVLQMPDYDQYRLRFTGVDEFLGQLFVYAQDIEILSPDYLKDAFVEKAKAALGKNEDPKKKRVA